MRLGLGAVACLLPGVAFGQVTNATTGVGYGTIQDAVDAASSGDVIELDPGVYAENIVWSFKGLTIRAADPALGATIAPVSGRAFDVLGGQNFLTDLTVENGDQSCVEVESSDLTLAGTIIRNCISGASGGGINALGSDVTLIDSVVTANDASDGGGIYLDSGSTLTMVGGEISDNTASNGAGVYVSGGADVTMEGVRDAVTGAVLTPGPVLRGNIATMNGGALYAFADVQTSTVSVTDAFLDGNTADIGGGVYAQHSANVTLIRNAACGNDGLGGAVYFDGESGSVPVSVDGALQVWNSRFSYNTGSLGTVTLVSGSAQVYFSEFLDNNALGQVAVQSLVPSLEVTHSIFMGSNQGGTALSGEGTSNFNLFFDNAFNHTGNITQGPDDLTGIQAQYIDYGGDCTTDLLFPLAYAPQFDNGLVGDVDGDGIVDQDAGATTVLGAGSSTVLNIGLSGGPYGDLFWWYDGDSDAWVALHDCDDTNRDTYPNADEYCDGVDNDCNGVDDDDATAVDAILFYPDVDGDTYGDSSVFGTPYCDGNQPSDLVPDGFDCDDTNAAINPGADEVCADAGLDQNCDGDPDLNAVDATVWYADLDGDGFGDASVSVASCTQPMGYVTDGSDCDDGQPGVYPGAAEVCDGVDNNCSGDETDVAGWTEYYADTDGDGFGDAGSALGACDGQPSGYVPDSTDCNDNESAMYPGNTEVCDGLDNDCSGLIDDGQPTTDFYADTDGDGFGDGGIVVNQFCSPGAGWAEQGGDCDDNQVSVNPDAEEVCDGLDNDCDALTDLEDDSLVDGQVGYEDLDGDGYGAGDPIDVCDLGDLAELDGDCADTNADVNPGAEEVPGNDVDEDCDGVAQTGSGTGTGTGTGGTRPGPTTATGATGGEAAGCNCDSGSGALPMSVVWLLGSVVLIRRRK